MFRASSTFGPPRMVGPPRMFGGRGAAAPAGVESEWCVSFSGGSQNAVAAYSMFSGNAPVSISHWVYLQSISDAGGGVYAGRDDLAGMGIGTYFYQGKIYCGYAYGNNWISSSAVMTSGRWYHVAIVKPAGAISLTKVYLDGVEVSGSVSQGNPALVPNFTGDKIYVGSFGSWSNADSYLNGRIDDVRIYSRALDSTEVAALANNTSDITTGLTAYMPLETGTTTPVLDSTGATIATATLVGGATWHPQTPPKLVSGRETSVRSLSFDGVDDKTSAFGVADNVSAFTLAVWIKRNVGEYGFVASGYTSGYVGLELYPTATYVNCSFTGSAIVSHSADGLWHHYVMVFDGSQTGNANRLKVYIDGVLPALTYSGTIPETVSTRFILGWRDWASRYAKMMADDVRVYSRAIDSTDIQKLCCGQSPTTNDPVGWWKCDETSGTLVADYGSGGNDGTCVGGVTRSTDVPAWLAP